MLDVNILLPAHRTDHPHHDLVYPWLAALVQGEEPFGAPNSVWASFVRIATHRRIFAEPSPLSEAFAFLRAIQAQPGYLNVGAGPCHVSIFERTCRDGAAAGELVADAYLASIAIEHGAKLVSLDRDFARFGDLRWQLPG